jgi:mRNA interferase MazF
MALTRGDLVVIAARGHYTSKPRPAVVVQADLFNDTHASITICPVTSDIVDASLFRITIPPGVRTGLRSTSQAMADKIVSVPRATIDRTLGRLSADELAALDDALRTWLAL